MVTPAIKEIIERPRGRRGMHQTRSTTKRAQISEAAIKALALNGISGLTHRLVARYAGVSLAATTYYFDNKFDIVAEASRIALSEYIEIIRRAARVTCGANTVGGFRRFVIRLIHNFTERDVVLTMCWAEIILDARRHPESLALSQNWFSTLAVVWREIAEAANMPEAEYTARSAIDLVVGLLFITIANGLSKSQVDAVFLHGKEPIDAWRGDDESHAIQAVQRSRRKSVETRERILSAAIEILITEGVGGISYRSIAEKAGIAQAGPFYHFSTISNLLAAAEKRLFAESKQFYRDSAAAIGRDRSVEDFVERTATIFLREATEFAGKNLAKFAIWLQGARQPELRPMIWSAIADQHVAWRRVLSQFMTHQRPIDPLIFQALYAGKHVRILATGSTTEDLTLVRREFGEDFSRLLAGRFWM